MTGRKPCAMVFIPSPDMLEVIVPPKRKRSSAGYCRQNEIHVHHVPERLVSAVHAYHVSVDLQATGSLALEMYDQLEDRVCRYDDCRAKKPLFVIHNRYTPCFNPAVFGRMSHALPPIIPATSSGNFLNTITLYGARKTGNGRLPASADKLISV